MALCSKDACLVRYQDGGQEHERLEQFLEILVEIDMECLAQLLQERQKEEAVEILERPDQKIIIAQNAKELKRYTLTEAAEILEITRQGLYYWIRKGWVKVNRDGRDYPVFTVFDIERIVKWRDTIHRSKNGQR